MKKTSLVLEGGGMRGIFTAGVLDCFLDEGLAFDSVYGVSAGACHACSYLSGQRGRAFRTNVEFINDWRYCSFRSLLLTGDFFGVDFVYHEIPDKLIPYDHAAFEQNPTDFYAVVTNCQTGKAEYMRVEELRHGIAAVQASASLPLLSRMVEIDGTPYLDGGVGDSIPLQEAMDMGHSKNVVILTQPAGYRKGPNELMPLMKRKYKAYPELLQAIGDRHLRYNASVDAAEAAAAAGEAFLLRPKEDLNLGRIERDETKLKQAYLKGYAAAKAALPALKAYLETE